MPRPTPLPASTESLPPAPRFLSSLYGYDSFISYLRQDGGYYAVALTAAPSGQGGAASLTQEFTQ
jgi:hypothetical protein